MSTFTTRLLRSFILVSILVGAAMAVTACTTGAGFDSNGVSGQRYIGVFIPQQSPAVDRIAAGKHENDYFMPLWKAYERGKVDAASAEVTVYLYKNGDRIWSRTKVVDGYEKFAVDGSLIDSETSLCVATPWEPAHQTVQPIPKVACADDIYPYMKGGRGRTSTDAYGVIAIKPAG